MQRECVIKSILAEMDQFRSTSTVIEKPDRRMEEFDISRMIVLKEALGTLHIILPYNKQRSQNIDKVTHFDHDG
jgi:hypothetical protein